MNPDKYVKGVNFKDDTFSLGKTVLEMMFLQSTENKNIK